MLHDLFVLGGENKYEIDDKIKKAKEQYDIKEINEPIDFADLINLLNTPVLFESQSLYIIRHENILNDDEHFDLLEKYLSSPSPFAKGIIAINKKIDSRKKVVKFFKEKGLFLEYGYKKGRELQKWVKEYIWSHGFKIEDQGVDYLIEVVGDNQEMLKSEIEKLFLFEPEGNRIDIELLKAILTDNAQSNIFNLLDSLFSNQDKMLQSLENLIKLKEPVSKIIFMLIREIKTILRAKWLVKEKYNDDKIINLLELHHFYGKKKIVLAKKIPFEDLICYLKRLYEVEVKLKSGKGDGIILLKSTLLKMK